MPDDRRAWHRGGGACLFIVKLLRCGRTTCARGVSVCRGAWGPPRTRGAIRFAIAPYVPWCAGSAEIIHHPMEHGLTGRVVDSPCSTFHRLVAEGVYPEGRAGRHAAACGHAAATPQWSEKPAALARPP